MCVCVCVQMCVVACQALHLYHLAIYPSDCPSAHLSLWLFICGSNQEVFQHVDAPFIQTKLTN